VTHSIHRHYPALSALSPSYVAWAVQTCFRCFARFLVIAQQGQRSVDLGRPVPASWLSRLADDWRAASPLINGLKYSVH
jgi:hypothetical protein